MHNFKMISTMKQTKNFIISLLIALPLFLSAQQAVNIGDILCTDGSTVSINEFASSGKTALGVVFYVDDSEQHGWAVHLEYQGKTPWCYQYIDVPELTNIRKFRDAIKDTDGYNNTKIIRNYSNASVFPAAWAVDFDNGWYLPAAGQIRQLYGYIPEINQSLNTVSGEPFILSSNWWIWASTECDSEGAWDINYMGAEGHSKKEAHNFYVRAVRTF